MGDHNFPNLIHYYVNQTKSKNSVMTLLVNQLKVRKKVKYNIFIIYYFKKMGF